MWPLLLKNIQKTDRTFSYIYSHPNSYEPPAQICTGYKGEETQSETGAQHIHYFHCDQIGAPREMTDEAGNLLWYADYKGWGGIREVHNLKDAHQPFRLQNQVDPLGLVVQVIAASWLLEALAYATTAMTGILVGVGIMDAMEESEDSSGIEQVDSTESQSTTVTISSCSEKEKRKRCKKWGMGTPVQAQLKVRRQQAPRGIYRIDRADGNATKCTAACSRFK